MKILKKKKEKNQDFLSHFTASPLLKSKHKNTKETFHENFE